MAQYTEEYIRELIKNHEILEEIVKDYFVKRYKLDAKYDKSKWNDMIMESVNFKQDIFEISTDVSYDEEYDEHDESTFQFPLEHLWADHDEILKDIEDKYIIKLKKEKKILKEYYRKQKN